MTTSKIIDELRQFPLVYVGSPYTKYPLGIHLAFVEACRLTCKLMQMGINVYSPIAHTHPLATYGNVDPLSHAIWIKFDEAIMAKADAMIVLMLDTWEKSYGVTHEIQSFKDSRKPVYYLEPEKILTWTS